jgi:hypothetical protein
LAVSIVTVSRARSSAPLIFTPGEKKPTEVGIEI